MVVGSSYSACVGALREIIETGKLKSAVDKVYPLEQATKAHRRVETDQRLGIVVIAVGNSEI